jgi:hypothetical protein
MKEYKCFGLSSLIKSGIILGIQNIINLKNVVNIFTKDTKEKE